MTADVHYTMAAQSMLRQRLSIPIATSILLVAASIFLVFLARRRCTGGEKTAKLSMQPEFQQRNLNPTERHRALYYKLQNLERFPGIVPEARDTLLEWFSEALESARTSASMASSILSITNYSKDGLTELIHNEHNSHESI
jgi:hypothetical protein